MKLIKRNDDWGLPTIWEDFFNNDLLNLPTMAKRGVTVPPVNISETEKEYLVELAAPGMKKADFKVNLEHNVLTISTETRVDQKEESKNFTRKEFSYQSFERSFTLPESINQDKIDARYNEGVLKVVLPKKEEVISKTKEIKIS
jgi:HSP20 family protein